MSTPNSAEQVIEKPRILFGTFSVECSACGWIEEDLDFDTEELAAGVELTWTCDCSRRIGLSPSVFAQYHREVTP